MALRTLNSTSGFSVGQDIDIDIISNIGNVTPVNLTVSELSDLGTIANITISGGLDGQYLTTDGAGTLSFSTGTPSGTIAPMPTLIPSGTTETIGANYQGLFSSPITIEGTLDIDGVLIDVSSDSLTVGGSNTQIQFNPGVSGALGGSANFTFDSVTNLVTVTGNVVATNNIQANNQFTLDTSTNANISNAYINIASVGDADAPFGSSNGAYCQMFATGSEAYVCLNSQDGDVWTMAGRDNFIEAKDNVYINAYNTFGGADGIIYTYSRAETWIEADSTIEISALTQGTGTGIKLWVDYDNIDAPIIEVWAVADQGYFRINDTVDLTGTIDDDSMATASASTLATSESIKAYVDSTGGAYNDYIIKTADFTCTAKAQIICNNASIPFTITLPASPAVGDSVTISNAGAATVTIGRNGSNINSVASNASLLTDNTNQLVYVDATIGWYTV